MYLSLTRAKKTPNFSKGNIEPHHRYGEYWRFYTIDVLSVWTNVGKHSVVHVSGYASQALNVGILMHFIHLARQTSLHISSFKMQFEIIG